MTDQYHATPEQWDKCINDARTWGGAFVCIIELRARIEALEAAQHAHITEPAPDAQPLPLVELVADAIAAQATSAGIVNDRPARAAIRAVAEWLAQNGKIALS